MPLNFPNSPSFGDVYTSGSQSWTWDGTVWAISSQVPAGGVYAPLAGATFTGQANGIVPVAAANMTRKDYVDAADALKVNLAGGTMSGLLVLSADPSVALGAATKQYVDTAAALKVNLAGGTMSGLLVLSADPSAALGAATKQYVDGLTANDAKTNVANTFTSNQTIANTATALTLNDTDATLGSATTNRLILQSSGSQAGLFGFNGSTVMYMQNNIGVIYFDVDPGNIIAGSQATFAIDGTTAARVETGGTVAPNTYSIITREKGDARYVVLSGLNTLDSTLTIANTGPQVSLQDTDATPVSGTSTAQVAFRASDASVMGIVGYNSSTVLSLLNNNNNVLVSADVNANLGANVGYTSFRVNNTECARVNAVGTGMSTTVTVATREKGDARWAAISDERMKTNIRPQSYGKLEKLMQLKPASYEWKEPSVARPSGPRLGLIAQDVQSIFPDAVVEWEDGTLGIDTLAMIGILIKAVQELYAA